jgi:predicted deacylase
MPTVAAQHPAVTPPSQARQRSVAALLAPLDQIVVHSSNLVANVDAVFKTAGEPRILPRYLFVGPKAGDTPVHIGIFAGIHGDEPEGVGAVVQFIKLLEAKPELAAGYYLSFYPVCNPTGLEDGTRHARSGKDLNRKSGCCRPNSFRARSTASSRCTPTTRAPAFTASPAARY